MNQNKTFTEVQKLQTVNSENANTERIFFGLLMKNLAGS